MLKQARNGKNVGNLNVGNLNIKHKNKFRLHGFH